MEHLREKALEVHKKYQGKIEIHPKFPIKSKDDLSLAYTPGVAEPCKEIQKNYNTIYDYTSKGNLVAIVQTERRFWGSEISAQARVCPSWKEKPFCLSNSAESTLSPSA